MKKISQWLSEFLAPGELKLTLTEAEQKIALPLLHYHLLAPRAYRRLNEQSRLASLLPEHQESLRRAAIACARMHAIASVKIPQLREAFAKAGLAVIFLKGASLAQRHFPHPEDRIFSDFDLFLRPKDRTKASELLFTLDYELADARPKFEANKNRTDFRHKTEPLLWIDSHFWLGHGRYEIKGAWDRAILAKGIWELDPIDEYLFLLYHAVVQHRVEKLAWIADLQCIRAQPNFPHKAALQRAKEMNLESAWNLAEYWMDRLEGKAKADPSLDSWWEKITMRQLDGNYPLLLVLRSRIYGGWPHLLDYAVKHQAATFYFRTINAWKSLREGPQ
jgi:hypothetical protein